MTLSKKSFAQYSQYNLNSNNGLPSNTVYRTLVDSKGYLWIATDKGIVKYNGYTTKVFDVTSGLRSDDIWNIFEDYKGRIWLGTISDEMGYIYNDKYHKAFCKDKEPFYPTDFVDYKDGIMFLTGDKMFRERICIERNDTIYLYIVDHKIRFYGHFLYKDTGILQRESQLWYINFKPGGLHFTALKSTAYEAYGNYVKITGKYLFPLTKHNNDTQIHVFDIKNDQLKHVSIQANEDPVVTILHKKNYYLTTTKKVYKLDEDLNIISQFTSDSIFGAEKSNIMITTFLDDDFTKRTISTSNAGLFIQVPANKFMLSNKPFFKNSYVGSYLDSIYYFWSSTNKALYGYSKKNILLSTQYLNINRLEEVLLINHDQILLINNQRSYQLINGNVVNLFPIDKPLFKKTNTDPPVQIQTKNLPEIQKRTFHPVIKDCIVDSENIMHIVNYGFGYWQAKLTDDALTVQIIDSGRYASIIYYPALDINIVYGKNAILLQKGNQIIKLNDAQLSVLGINMLQQISIDNNNIFIKTRKKLFIYNPLKKIYRSLLNHYNLSTAAIHIYNHQIVAVGRYGVVLLNLSSSELLNYINFKAQNYHYINSSYIIADTLYIDSDRGGYAVNLAENNNAIKDFKLPYKLIATTKFSEREVSLQDTILIDHNRENVGFDFINPYGDGAVKYTYSIDNVNSGNWASAGRIEIPNLYLGKFHKMSLIVNDDSWQSDEYTLYLYIKPLWWQTNTGKTWLFILSFLGISVISLGTVLATKSVLNRKHARENKYLELELKSIYAQLNPHFIFNTLSNIIYYIKKDRKNEASKYLNSFSKLLRSYIKSSRNKWLQLNEEIENIENYIILQQSRFENKFDYAINIDEGLDTDNILLPSLLLQPLVENAIHHGLQQKEEKGMLTLSFKKTSNDNVIIITIEDDGIGRTKAKEFSKNSLHKKESFGSNLIEDLITIYKRYELFNIDIDYYDKQAPDTGTLVTLTIETEPQ